MSKSQNYLQLITDYPDIAIVMPKLLKQEEDGEQTDVEKRGEDGIGGY